MITLGLGQRDWSLGYEASRVWGIHTLPFPLHILVFFIFQYWHLKVKELCFLYANENYRRYNNRTPRPQLGTIILPCVQTLNPKPRRTGPPASLELIESWLRESQACQWV